MCNACHLTRRKLARAVTRADARAASAAVKVAVETIKRKVRPPKLGAKR